MATLSRQAKGDCLPLDYPQTQLSKGAIAVEDCAKLNVGAGLQMSPGPTQRQKSTSNARAALLAVMEVQCSLNQLEDKCNEAYKDAKSSSLADWKITTQAAEEEETCTEFTSPPSRSSSGVLGATSVTPNSPELDINFDGHELGFWGDVGVKTSQYLKGRFEEKAPMLAISEENVMPWDL